MGHRHVFGTSHMLDNELEQSWSYMHPEQSYTNPVMSSTADNGSFLSPVQNMSVDGRHYSSHWNPMPRSSGYTASSHNVEGPQYHPDTSVPSYDLFLHPSASGSFGPAPESYAHCGSTSSYERQTFHGTENGFVDLTMGSGRGPHKRKSPGIPSICERGSSSRCLSTGTCSDLPLPSELQQEKPNMDARYMHWDRVAMTPAYRGNGLSIRGESSMRNVRSRPAIDIESSTAGTYLSSNSSHTSYSTSPIDHSSSVDLSGQSSGTLTWEWGNFRTSPGHGRIQVPDSSGFSHDTKYFMGSSSSTNASLEVGGNQHDFISNRDSIVSHNFHGASTQPIRGIRGNYSQRPSPSFRASSSIARVGHVAVVEEGMQLAAESYPSRHHRPLSAVTWQSSERNGRSRIFSDRDRLLPEDAAFHDRFSSESLMIVDRSALYGPRMFDQHRDMRLDIDNMTYEELLALGERMGSVSTGLSEDLMSKCLKETIYCSSNHNQEVGTCVICLEEYRDMDGVGTLKTCGHDYHVSCIKKWLSMKNTCPVCKASVVGDDMKQK